MLNVAYHYLDLVPTTNLSVRAPRCPACPVEIKDDGEVRSCPRCGRAFPLPGTQPFAAVMSACIVVAVKWLEERDLRKAFGADYERYQRDVPMLLPVPNRSRKHHRPEMLREPERGPGFVKKS